MHRIGSFPRFSTSRLPQIQDEGSRKVQKPRKKTFVDEKLLENATEAILKIVHHGRGRKVLEARERERERIKEHVLRTMKADSCSKACHRTRCLPETSNQMAKRMRFREERKMPTEPQEKLRIEPEKVPDDTIDHFSFDAPHEITGLADLPSFRKPTVSKHVSFLSPEKPLSTFKTPSRPARLANPPPVLRQKRAFCRQEQPELDSMPASKASAVAPESSEDPVAPSAAPQARVPYDLLGIGVTESIFD